MNNFELWAEIYVNRNKTADSLHLNFHIELRCALYFLQDPQTNGIPAWVPPNMREEGGGRGGSGQAVQPTRQLQARYLNQIPVYIHVQRAGGDEAERDEEEGEKANTSCR